MIEATEAIAANEDRAISLRPRLTPEGDDIAQTQRQLLVLRQGRDRSSHGVGLNGLQRTPLCPLLTPHWSRKHMIVSRTFVWPVSRSKARLGIRR